MSPSEAGGNRDRPNGPSAPSAGRRSKSGLSLPREDIWSLACRRNPSQLPRWRLPGRFGGANRGGAVSRPGAHENRSPACATRGGANPGEVRPLRRFNIAITVRYTRKGAVGSVSSVFTTAFTSVHSRLSFTTVVHNRLSFTTACRSQPPCPRPCCALESRLCEDAIFFGHP